MSAKLSDEWTPASVERALKRNNPKTLAVLVINVVLSSDDFEFAQDLCVRLAHHPDEWVRGNAILGFGHLARLDRKLDRKRVRPLILAARHDPSKVVRGQAECAMSDTRTFLRWRCPRT